jgi:hypothetical protein
LPLPRFIARETELLGRKALFAVSAVVACALVGGLLASTGLPPRIAVLAALPFVVWLAYRTLWARDEVVRVPAVILVVFGLAVLIVVEAQRALRPVLPPITYALVLACAMLGSLVLLLAIRWRHETTAQGSSVPLLSPRRDGYLKRVEAQLHDDLTLADFAYDRAYSMHELGSHEEARELLHLGLQMIERFTPDLMRLLAMMTVYSRMLSAVAPVRPLVPARLRTARAAALVRYAWILYTFLGSVTERYRFHLYIISQGTRLLLRHLNQTTESLCAANGRTPDQVQNHAWDLLRAIRADFHALTDESIESLRTLLVSLDAAPATVPVHESPDAPPATELDRELVSVAHVMGQTVASLRSLVNLHAAAPSVPSA